MNNVYRFGRWEIALQKVGDGRLSTQGGREGSEKWGMGDQAQRVGERAKIKLEMGEGAPHILSYLMLQSL